MKTPGPARIAGIGGRSPDQPTSRWYGLTGMVALGAGMVLVTAVAVVDLVAVAEAWLGMLSR
ncbi:hypothetical protein [Kribbella lupini]|uniref:Uncharacterized protein n=1 Tax=Kribbella lupini TaxID=291602 RepID=A0ABN2ALS2_9ACTN